MLEKRLDQETRWRHRVDGILAGTFEDVRAEMGSASTALEHSRGLPEHTHIAAAEMCVARMIWPPPGVPW